MSRRVLILGMGGQFGSAAARSFRAAGWNVDRYHRGTDIGIAARGARWIINAMNPPNYHDWDTQIPKITSEVLAAARDSGASLMVPANVYVYGREPSPWGPETPHHACTRKGRIRAEMESRYRNYAAEGNSVVMLRGGDFVNPESPQSLLNQVVLKDLRKGKITAMGKPEARRCYADLGDLTQIAVALADTADSLPGLLDLCYPGTVFSFRELADELGRQLGREISIKRFPWTMMSLASPVWELARELREMRYLYDMDHQIDGTEFADLFPDFEPKTLQRLVFEHLYLRGMKVVPDAQGASAMSTQTSL
ncbi:epimerase [Thioclava dalianensis]|uniref:Epimerase n=1 Tax=Thioclava dalianensis TaxID=1185766 RepID=A0A074TIS1_9RHOB|nr:epimerase [Thioclava dalianensis]KEP68908.1 epimerase [Thioclava dalianensis]SFN35610.1 Nucleoside-diphosphate-sugar epimerase [Thioclava dalianensis]